MLGVLGALTLMIAASPALADDAATTRAGGCDVRLELRRTEPVLVFRSDCPLAVAETRTALTTLLGQLFPDRRWPAGVQSMSLGRIDGFPWLSARLAVAAARDAGWDVRRGRPREGSDNAFVMRVLDRERLLGDVASVLAGWGVAVRSSSVEKVLVAPAGTLGIAGALREAGIEAEARVPFDAQLWLRVVGR